MLFAPLPSSRQPLGSIASDNPVCSSRLTVLNVLTPASAPALLRRPRDLFSFAREPACAEKHKTQAENEFHRNPNHMAAARYIKSGTYLEFAQGGGGLRGP